MPKDMSFLPEDYLERRAARRTNMIALTLFVVVIVVVVGTWFITGSQLRESLAENKTATVAYQEAGQKLDQMDELREQKAEMERKAEIAAVLVERLQRSVMLAELINHMPATVSWLEFELETKTLRRAQAPSTALARAQQRNAAKAAAQQHAAPRPPETRSTIKLVGVAPTDVQVAEFISALSTHPAFSNVSLQYSEKSKVQDAELRKFEVEMLVRSAISDQDLQPSRVPRRLKLDPMAETIQIDEDGRLILPDPAVATVPTDTAGE
ncbi:MAG: PilN domain-containing protein [Planctomycetota bacterium]